MFFQTQQTFNVKPSPIIIGQGIRSSSPSYTYIPSIKTMGLLLHLQHYQRYEPMVFKMWVKSKFVLCEPR